MPFRIRVSLAILLALLVLLIVGPFLIPVPALEGTSPATNLAGDDSRFTRVEGVDLHYFDLGGGEVPAGGTMQSGDSPGNGEATGGEPAVGGDAAFLLLHGYPSNSAGWRPVLPELSLYGRVIAFDRPGFGLSSRPLPGSWPRGENPYLPAAQVEQAIGLMNELDVEKAVLIASSTGGLTALQMALAYPERIGAVVLESAPIYSNRAPPGWLRPLLATPQMSRLGPLLMRQLGGSPGERLYASQWADPERIGERDVEDFELTFRVDDWDRGLWQVSRASRPFRLEGELSSLRMPVLVIAGAADPIVPAEESERLAGELPQATLALMEGCGHIPHRECPAEFMQVVADWLQGQAPPAE